ncbi:Lar family restriction alleviation protein [Bordetella genomosp. 9]|nr:Lar family restriction alleviation protein [Bordetella genomosp. 9]
MDDKHLLELAAKLKPCPFCGSPGALEHASGSWGYYPGKWWVKCPSCGVSGKGFEDEKWESGKGTTNISAQAKGDAIAWWNRRASPAQQAGGFSPSDDPKTRASTGSEGGGIAQQGAPTDAELIGIAVDEFDIDYDRMPYSVVKFARRVLARYAPAQDAEPIAWESTTPVYFKYITDSQYRKFSAKVRAWYRPYRCATCAKDAERVKDAALHPNHLLDLRYILAVLERLSKAAPKDSELSAAVTGMRYVVSRTEDTARAQRAGEEAS